ncbi:hypothetical protein B296_00044502 [Ensete ventricosum]|uniref:Uncharacterized protein n=1 Tax=Ensete ventricosum TaxID=4639 RepID=A0A426ZAY6_ENSVE|nr:hypothetical protein B296_00044502 [Ensete ventricosum]
MTRVIRVRKSDPRLNVRGQSRDDQDRAAAFNTWMPHPAATATIPLSRDQIRVVLPSDGQSCRRLVTCPPLPRFPPPFVFPPQPYPKLTFVRVPLCTSIHLSPNYKPQPRAGGAGRTSSFPTHTSPFPSLPRKTRRRRRIKPSTFLSFNS